MEEALVGKSDAELDKLGYVNQHGLSRKVDAFFPFLHMVRRTNVHLAAYI
jgi:hypothetical protein